jgi:hypothetical protein
MVGLQVDIYENEDEDPSVTHIFWGKTKADAVGVSRAHEKTDEFYAGAVQSGVWNEIPLTVEETWLDGEGDEDEEEDEDEDS